MKMKQLYRGAFNANGFIKIEYARAYTERQAWAIMCRRIAEKDGVGVLTVMGIFNGKRDNYQISIENESSAATR